ncbi:MAG: hypothetical protein WCI72_02240 [archaeon]
MAYIQRSRPLKPVEPKKEPGYDSVSPAEVARDYNSFYSYLDVARGLGEFGERDSPALRRDLKTTAYQRMEGIAEKYPVDSVLQNKLDEAERVIWPHGRR